MTKGPLWYGPLPPLWRNEPHARVHPFPACSALACYSTEPPCCRSETLGCQRETGAEIRDHPPSPPVSTVPVSVGIGQGRLNPRIGWILSLLRREKGFMWLERLPLVLASFLPLCRSSAPDSSQAFVSIRVTGTCRVGRSGNR